MSDESMDGKKREDVFNAWLKNCPREFPEYFDIGEKASLFFNPLIGGDYRETNQNILYTLEALKTFVVPSGSGEGFSLNEEGAIGFATLLECLTSALKFEFQRCGPE